MTDLRKAAEQALEALDGGAFGGYRDMVVETLRQALQDKPPVKTYCGGKPNYCTPEQEPVAWADKVGAVIPHSHKLFQPDLLKDYTRPLYAAPVDAVNISQERVDETAKREQEPIGYINGIHGGYMVFTPLNPSAVYLNGTALYTTPPKREWFGLTDEEMRTLKQKSVDDGMTRIVSDFEYIRSIEAKLKEKNCG